jgi:hypothetical protein
MKKCEVLQDTVISVLKGSIVMVSDKQYELKRHKLKPVEEVKKVEKPVVKEIETREEKAIETPELPKEKKSKKK